MCSSGELLPCVDGFDNHQATWDSWLRPSRQRNLVGRKATKNAPRSRVLRKRGRHFLHKETRLGAAPALKRPATGRLTASRVGRACWHAYGSDVTSMLQLLAACYTTAFDMTAICLYGITILWQQWAQAVPQTSEQPTNQPSKQTHEQTHEQPNERTTNQTNTHTHTHSQTTKHANKQSNTQATK